MTVYPAIDLRGGRCVRLLQGAFERETVYGDDPVAVARGFEAAGARWLHVVDLDGARAGHPVQHELVARICAAVHIPVQLGGGLRDRAAIEAAFATGASRVVVGTTAAHDPDRCGELCAAHPGRVVVGLDVRGGQVRVAGWTEAATPDPLTLARRVATLGAAAIVYTDIARVGTERGPDLERTSAIARAAGVPVIASGGIGSLDDVRAVAARAADGVAGMIIGRALYTGAIRLEDALAAAGDR
ncbi:MAG: 1-(5-phosphoribosyl)-5-[(5-phosphoribosylamino)methylideneamino]imidazole-4-carboxamide isomerase [Deltaproteobacteria bacterium]|nr:MAG: 1-(5-phosphoribosyl)-5-[(5-phosphoribosylamino)methylideneamino]imidazole-4-carboxamide isomerase [Deltaproteobacteria bacterium]